MAQYYVSTVYSDGFVHVIELVGRPFSTSADIIFSNKLTESHHCFA